FPAEVLAGVNQVPRNDLVLQNPLLAVNVLQVQIECGNTLGEAALDHIPFGPGNNSRHQVEGEETLRATPIAVNRERNSLHKVRQVCQLAALLKDVERHAGEL